MAQGAELARRGHRVHVVTRAIAGYPVDDEEYRGVFIHRWIKTVRGGPLFAMSFLTGIAGALRRLRFDFDVIHTHQALWEAAATGLFRPLFRGKPTLIQPASAGYYGEAEELGARAVAGPSSARFSPIPHSRRSPPRSSASGLPWALHQAGSYGRQAASMPSNFAPARVRLKTVSFPARA